MDEHYKITMEKDGDHVLVHLTWNRVPPVDRERRIKASQDVVRSMVRRASGIEIANDEGSVTFRIPYRGERRLQGWTTRIKARINQILLAPLTPKAVDRALGITARERLRWYKDGRLPTCGRARIDHGEYAVQFPLFPFEGIARIQADPGLIAAWRRRDAADEQCRDAAPTSF